MTSPEMTSSRCIAFSNSAPQQHRCIVVLENTVKVFDPIAGHFTTCHIMPAWAQCQMISAARAEVARVAYFDKARAEAKDSDAACYLAQDEAEKWEEQRMQDNCNGRIY